eukprot:6216696-Amphidinium_carterae.5
MAARKDELEIFISAVLDRNLMSRAEASTRKGRMQFYDAQLWARAGALTLEELDVAARSSVETAMPLSELQKG